MLNKTVIVGFLFLLFLSALNGVILLIGLEHIGVPVEITWETWWGAWLICFAVQGNNS